MKEMSNSKTVNVKVTRHELVKLLIAVTTADCYASKGTQQWKDLHAKLAEQLKNFDEKNGANV